MALWHYYNNYQSFSLKKLNDTKQSNQSRVVPKHVVFVGYVSDNLYKMETLPFDGLILVGDLRVQLSFQCQRAADRPVEL